MERVSNTSVEASEELKFYNRKFHFHLQPIKVMLRSKKTLLSDKKWLALVEKTKAGILLNPNEYLGEELPTPEQVEMLVGKIFDGFLKDLKSRS